METILLNGVPAAAHGLVLNKYKIGTAAANTEYIKIPGMNGKLDITDFLGVTYNNRPISAVLTVRDNGEYIGARSYLESLNGQQVQVIFSRDSGLYWSGRLALEDYDPLSATVNEITISIDAEPFPRDVLTGEVINNHVSDFY